MTPRRLPRRKRLDAPSCVNFVVIPPGGPQTKPKACNVGLALADGKYLVIYDAEDQPEPAQLREIVSRFADDRSGPSCACRRGSTTSMPTRTCSPDASRSSTRCGSTSMLPGLDAWRLPIPLGGTSNHFTTSVVAVPAGLGSPQRHRGCRPRSPRRCARSCRSASRTRRRGRRRARTGGRGSVSARDGSRGTWSRRSCTPDARGASGKKAEFAGRSDWSGSSWARRRCSSPPILWALFLYSFLGGSTRWVGTPAWVKDAASANLVIGNVAVIVPLRAWPPAGGRRTR